MCVVSGLFRGCVHKLKRTKINVGGVTRKCRLFSRRLKINAKWHRRFRLSVEFFVVALWSPVVGPKHRNAQKQPTKTCALRPYKNSDDDWYMSSSRNFDSNPEENRGLPDRRITADIHQYRENDHRGGWRRGRTAVVKVNEVESMVGTSPTSCPLHGGKVNCNDDRCMGMEGGLHLHAVLLTKSMPDR